MNIPSRSEYRDYLIRYAETDPPQVPPPLTYSEFCAMLERWEREYHAAWIDGDGVHLTQLESLLLLCGRTSPEPHPQYDLAPLEVR